MSHALYFVVTSNTKDQGELVVVDSEFLRDNYGQPGPWNDDEAGGDHSMAPYFLPAIAREPRLSISTPEAMRITAALNVQGPAPRGVVLSNNLEGISAILDATGVDRFYPEARTVLVLSPIEEAVNEVASQGYGPLQAEVALADEETKEEARALEEEGVSPEDSEAQAIFRRYKLYGDAEDEPQEFDISLLLAAFDAPEAPSQEDGPNKGSVPLVAELGGLGLDEALEAVAPQEEKKNAAPHRRVPFSKFDGRTKAPGECLVQGLIDRYSGLAKGKAIVKKTIQKHFGEDNGGPSLENLHAFCKKFKIPLRVYTVMGTEVVALRHQTPPGERNARKGLVLMAYNHHAYFYTGGGLSTKIDLTLTGEHDVAGWHDTTGKLFKKKGKELIALEQSEEDVIFEFLKLSRQQNMSFRCEINIGARSLAWTTQEAAHECKTFDCCPRTAYDMNSAFHTSATMKDWTRLAGLHPSLTRHISRIPIFCVVDDYVENTGAVVFPPEDDWAITYFYVSKECQARWKASQNTHLVGRYTNLLVGLEYAYLTSIGAVSSIDVIGWKCATYGVSASKFADKIIELDKQAEAIDGMARGVFSLMNGLLGRVITRAGSVTTRLGSDDAELVRAGREDDERVVVDDEQGVGAEKTVRVKLEKGEREYRTINTRTFYDHVVAKTNLAIMLFVDQIQRNPKNEGVRLLKLRTDCACYERPVAIPDWAVSKFKRELPKYKPKRQFVQYHDPSELGKNVRAEIQNFVGSHCRIYVGSPGTGKTHSVIEGKQADEAMAFSNVLARNLDHGDVVGQTIHRALRLYEPNCLSKVVGRLKGKNLWLDELSTVQAHVWNIIYCVSQKLKLLILTGDMHQTPPVGEGSRERSVFFQELLGAAKELTVDYRNDLGLIRLREFIKKEEDPGRLAAGIQTEIARNPRLDATHMSAAELAAIDVHLTAFRKTRAAINRIVLRQRGLVFKYVDKAEKAPAGFMISKGVRLAAKASKSTEAIYSGAVYELMTAATPTLRSVRIRRIYNNGKPPGGEFSIDSKYLSCFEPGYAMTTHSCIGTTVFGQVLAVHELSKMVKWDKRIAYTAITRGCRLGDLRLCTQVPQCVQDEIGNKDEFVPPPQEEDDEDVEDPEELQERLDRAKRAQEKREWKAPMELTYARRDAPSLHRE